MFKKTLSSLTLLLTFFYTSTNFSQIVNNETELNTAIQNATAGTTITLANGTWKDVFIELSGKNGSSTAPITIEAETAGSVLMTGNSRVYLEGSYLTISGLIFQDPENLVVSGTTIEPVIELKECDNCKVLNNKIDTYNGTEDQKTLTFKWILNDGQYNEIAYNSFVGKYGVGSIINDNRNSSEADYLRIHHNYFADRTPINELNADNDQDAIRIGNSSTSLFDSYTEVFDNYFDNFFGEVEVISNKSGNNRYFNNTFRNYAGSLTLRHGDNCEVYGNFFFAEQNAFSAGVRVMGESHTIYNNYFQDTNYNKIDGAGSGATGAINVSNGRVDTELNGYYQVKNTTIVNNTFVNCDYALRVGTTVKDDLTLAPENLIVANNIFSNNSDSAIQEITAPTGAFSIYEGNITQNGDWDLTNNVNSNITLETSASLLVEGTNFYEIPSDSEAIGAGVGSYTFLANDIIDGVRDTDFDAGAEEYGANGSRAPYTEASVGVTVGFGSNIEIAPYIELNTNSIDFNVNASESSFMISSNTNWTITEDLSWVSLSSTSGSENGEIIVTVTENTTGTTRTGNLIVSSSEDDSVSKTIIITQTEDDFNPNNAEEIMPETVTAVGTQPDSTNGPENTVDNDVATRWSAESADGSAYLTYDLGCEHKLTDVSIYFHKNTERTTTISIGTSNDGINFTDVYTQVSSTLLTVGAYEDFDMNLIQARYIRIYGFGNSDGSAWNSIEEVKFYGDTKCSQSLSINDNFLLSSDVSIYPIPVSNGKLYIKSNQRILNNIAVYDLSGRKIVSKEVVNSFEETINTSKLKSGIYLLTLNNVFTQKFSVK